MNQEPPRSFPRKGWVLSSVSLNLFFLPLVTGHPMDGQQTIGNLTHSLLKINWEGSFAVENRRAGRAGKVSVAGARPSASAFFSLGKKIACFRGKTSE